MSRGSGLGGCLQWHARQLGVGAMEELNGGRRGWQTTKQNPEIGVCILSLVVLTNEAKGGLGSLYFKKLLR